MLYKNLPQRELKPVMRVRKVLDDLAACFFMLKGDMANFRAVLRARREYAKMRPLFEADRQENLRKSVCDEITGRYKFSILWQSKVRGRNAYAELVG